MQPIPDFLLKAALRTLARGNFAAYIAYLDQIGQVIRMRTRRLSKTQTISWLTRYIKPSYTLDDPWYFCAFEEAWIDEHLKSAVILNGEETYRRYLSPKEQLNQSTRQSINLGMRALALAIKNKPIPRKTHQLRLALLDQKACQAIASYKTNKQRMLDYTGGILAIVMSIVCSLITASAVALTLTAWPIGAAAIITVIVFSTMLAVNWISLKGIVPRMLNQVFGKDTLFRGWTHYRDEKTGKKHQLSFKKRIALTIAGVSAGLVSAAMGVINYGYIVSFGKLALFSFLTAGILSSVLLPPLGVFVALVFCVSSFVFMMKPVINILQARNIKQIIKRPFSDIAFIFDPNNKRNAGKSALRIKVEKGITYSILGLLSGVVLFGLIVLQVQDGAALARFFNASMAISSAIAVGIAYTLSMTAVLIGQLPYAMRAIARGAVAMVAGYRNLFNRSNKSHHITDIPLKNLPLHTSKHIITSIKKTVSVLSPNDKLTEKATSVRLQCLKAITTNHHKPYKRERYYQLYLFNNNKTTLTKHHRHSTKRNIMARST